MSTITIKQQTEIAVFLDTHHIPSGLGTEKEACSIAAINLCLTGKLTAKIPACMSEVIGRWIIIIQDAMPDEMRNSQEWKSLLPLAAGTGRDKEQDRKTSILSWMWNCLIEIQPIADQNNFGTEWKTMTDEKTPDAARDAARAAARAAANAADAAAAARAARAAARGARGARGARAVANAARAARAAGDAADAASDAARAASAAADAASDAAASDAARAAARAADAADDTHWNKINPCELLKQLVCI